MISVSADTYERMQNEKRNKKRIFIRRWNKNVFQ